MSRLWQLVTDAICAVRTNCEVKPLPPVDEDEYMKWLKSQRQASEDAIQYHRQRRQGIEEAWKRGHRHD